MATGTEGTLQKQFTKPTAQVILSLSRSKPVAARGHDCDPVGGEAVAGTGHVALVDVGEGRLVQDDVPDVIYLKLFSTF